MRCIPPPTATSANKTHTRAAPRVLRLLSVMVHLFLMLILIMKMAPANYSSPTALLKFPA
jgi:hypothetical protein